MTFFNNTGVPETHIEAIKFALPDNNIFTFGRPAKDESLIYRILSEGYHQRRYERQDGSILTDYVSRNSWKIEDNPKEAYNKMVFHSQTCPYYIIFGVSQHRMNEIYEDIENKLLNPPQDFIPRPEYLDSRRWWAIAVDKIADEQSSMLLPSNLKGHINLKSGIFTENDLFRDGYLVKKS